MMIVNADDWGRSRGETDSALACFSAGRVTSVSAMVFMEDSSRAASLAKDAGIDVGLHLNLSERFTGKVPSERLTECHNRIVRFLGRNKYSQLIYSPSLRKAFRHVFEAQREEFLRLYGKPPSHVDGHQHMHLCSNMLLGAVIPAGEKVRRSFSFWPGEKSLLNRTYRRLVDWWLARRYRLTDYFFALSQQLHRDRLTRVGRLARTANVELMTHPAQPEEYAVLRSEDYLEAMKDVPVGSYAAL